MSIKLVDKAISGYGYYHAFKNDQTGEVMFVKCTNEDYTKLGEVDGDKHNPTLDGYTWSRSFGEVPEIEGRMIQDGEVYTIGNDQMAKINGLHVKLEEGDVVDGEFVGVIKDPYGNSI